MSFPVIISIIFILIGIYMFYFAVKKMDCSKIQDLVLLCSVFSCLIPSLYIILIVLIKQH